MADALPRERWVLAGIVLFVVLGGLFPNAIVIDHSSEIDMVGDTVRTFDTYHRDTAEIPGTPTQGAGDGTRAAKLRATSGFPSTKAE